MKMMNQRFGWQVNQGQRMGMVSRMPFGPRMPQEQQMIRALSQQNPSGGNNSLAVGGLNQMGQGGMSQIGQGGMSQMGHGGINQIGGMMRRNPIGRMNQIRAPGSTNHVRGGLMNQMGSPTRMVRNPASMNQMPRLSGVNQSSGPSGMNQMAGLDGNYQMAGPGRTNQLGGSGGTNQRGTSIGMNQMGSGRMNQMQSSGGMGRGSILPMGIGNMNQQFPNQMMGNQMQMRMQGMQRQPGPPGAEMTRMRQSFMALEPDGTSYSNISQCQQQLAPPGVNESESEQVSFTTKVTDPKFAAQDEMEIEKLSVLQMQVKQWQQTQPVREFVQEFKNKMTGPPGTQPKEELEEEEFEKQYKEWEKQFEDWKTQNANHPNQELFKQYEKQWLQWKDEMNQRRKEIRRRRDERLLQQSRLIQNTFSTSASQGPQQNVLFQQPQMQQIQPSTVFPGSFGRGPLLEQTSQQRVATATSQEKFKASERQTVSDKDKASDTGSPTGSVGPTIRFPPKGTPGNALKSDTAMAPSNVDAKPVKGDIHEEFKDKVFQERTESEIKQEDSEIGASKEKTTGKTKKEDLKNEPNQETEEIKTEQGGHVESKRKQENNKEKLGQSESQENQESIETSLKEANGSIKQVETEGFIPKQEIEHGKKIDETNKKVMPASSENISENIIAADNYDMHEAISDDELATFDDQNEGSTDSKSNSLRSSKTPRNINKHKDKPLLDRFGRDISTRSKYQNDEKRLSKDRDSRERSYDRDNRPVSRDSYTKSRYDSRSSHERSHDKDHKEESSNWSKHSDERPSSSERRPAQYRDERYVNKDVELKEQEIKLLKEQKSKLESLKALQENISLKSLIGEQQKKKEEQQRHEETKKSALGLIGRAYNDAADELQMTAGPSGQRRLPPEDGIRGSVRYLDSRYKDERYDSRAVEPRSESDYTQPGWYRGVGAGRVSEWERRDYDRTSAPCGRDRMDPYRDNRYPDYGLNPYERISDPYRYPERYPKARYDDRYSRLPSVGDDLYRRLHPLVERDLGAPPTKIQVIDYGHTHKPVEASHSTVLSVYRTTPPPPPPPPVAHSRTPPPASHLRGHSPPRHHSLQTQDDVRGVNSRDIYSGYESAYQDPYNRSASDPYSQSDTYNRDYNSYLRGQRLEGTPPAPSHLDRYADAERRGSNNIPQTNQAEAAPVKLEIISIEDLLNKPGRLTRPRNIVIILRGPPGAGKSYLAKLIKEKEQAMGGTAPRIIALDDYFMVEKEKMIPDPESGRMAMQKVLEYEYEAEMEEAYRSSMHKAFKKTIEDGFFNFVIVDACHARVREFEDMWSFAKQRGWQVYIAEVMGEKNVCQKRNIHGRTVADIVGIINAFEPAPRHMIQLDVRSLLQDAAITEVEMEDYTGDEANEANKQVDDDDDEEGGFTPKSRWEKMDETKLDRLDGLIMAHKHQKPTLEEFLQLPDDYEQRQSQPGKKRVRWADIEERKATQRARDIGFVVGQTDWKRMLDDSHVMMALQKTKYI